MFFQSMFKNNNNNNIKKKLNNRFSAVKLQRQLLIKSRDNICDRHVQFWKRVQRRVLKKMCIA